MQNSKTTITRLFVIGLYFCCSHLATAQTYIGIKGSAGLGWLSQVYNESIDYDTESDLALTGGVYVKTMLSENTLLGVDLLYSSFTTHDVNHEFDFYNSVYGYGYGYGYSFLFDISNNFQFSNLNLPIYCGFLVKNWEFDLGINFQADLGSEGDYVIEFQGDRYVENLDVEANDYNIGIFIGVNYRISNYHAFSLNYYGSFIRAKYQNIFLSTAGSIEQERFSGMLTLGMNFNLYQTNDVVLK